MGPYNYSRVSVYNLKDFDFTPKKNVLISLRTLSRVVFFEFFKCRKNLCTNFEETVSNPLPPPPNTTEAQY